MGLKKINRWMEKHALLVIVLFFQVMLGIAWAANEHLGERATLDTMPADDDKIAIYDTSTTTGFAQAVSVFRGDKLPGRSQWAIRGDNDQHSKINQIDLLCAFDPF